MRSIAAALLVALVCGACGSTSSSSSCSDYQAEVQRMIETGAPADELNTFIEETEDHVARLISRDPESAAPCMEAVFEALFTSSFDELGLILDGQ